GSLAGMAKDPVATAASNNPELSTLVSAVKKAGLVDTLNNAKDITVFAPTNAAFEKIPQADLEALLNDKAELTKVLTYHVVGE
ncbi:fasciclin domain-containing protein, partial [Streptomyces sp. SID7499]|nr:fasciclin domain-containing protein [Streptomyces sp. SID7499]